MVRLSAPTIRFTFVLWTYLWCKLVFYFSPLLDRASLLEQYWWTSPWMNDARPIFLILINESRFVEGLLPMIGIALARGSWLGSGAFLKVPSSIVTRFRLWKPGVVSRLLPSLKCMRRVPNPGNLEPCLPLCFPLFFRPCSPLCFPLVSHLKTLEPCLLALHGWMVSASYAICLIKFYFIFFSGLIGVTVQMKCDFKKARKLKFFPFWCALAMVSGRAISGFEWLWNWISNDFKLIQPCTNRYKHVLIL